jgi:hypothetical protein
MENCGDKRCATSAFLLFMSAGHSSSDALDEVISGGFFILNGPSASSMNT